MPREPTVFIVDDEQSVCSSLARVVAAMRLPVECYLSAEAFLKNVDATRPGCLVLDNRLPGMSGIELQTRLISEDYLLPVIFITGYGTLNDAICAMKHGAIDFLEKPFRTELLGDDIRHALTLNDRWLRQRTMRSVFTEHSKRLSPSERDVMDKVVEGKASKLIAAELGISLRTVQSRKACILRKMELDNWAKILKLAIALEHSSGDRS